MVLVSSISNFFTNKTYLASKWMGFSSSYSALGSNFSLLIKLIWQVNEWVLAVVIRLLGQTLVFKMFPFSILVFSLWADEKICILSKVFMTNCVYLSWNSQIFYCPKFKKSPRSKVIHPKYCKHLKEGAHQSHLGRRKVGWFLAD